jgi:hypothetical protein
MRFIYTSEQLAFIESEYKKVSYGGVATAFNIKFSASKTAAQIKSVISNHKFTCGRKTSEINKGCLKLFNVEQANFIKKGYQKWSIELLTANLNNEFNSKFTSQQVRSFTRNHGIKSGRTGQFKSGCIPFNAGTKGVMKLNKTSFKKGVIAHNHQPIGSYRVTTEGFPQYKLSDPANWVNESALVWIAHHGEYKDGMKIYHRDGNKLNTDIKNLVLVDCATSLYLTRMSLKTLPNELKDSAILVARIDGKVANIKKGAA